MSSASLNPTVATTNRDNLIGSIWMVAAMGLFAIEDASIKVASTHASIGQVLMFFGLGGAMLFALIAAKRGDRLVASALRSSSMRYRMLSEVAGRLFYSMAVVLTPLSATTVILQATPLVVVACAAMLFRERVGIRRWSAVFVGLTGVIVVVGPGRDSFSMLSILAVLGMLGFAGRDLASRAAPPTVTTAVLGLYGFISVFMAGCLLAIWKGEPFSWPELSLLLPLTVAVCVGVSAYACLMKAMRTGDVSAVTPFRYSRLLFGIGLGIFWFQESLSTPMVAGSALIVVSGLIILGGRRDIESSKPSTISR